MKTPVVPLSWRQIQRKNITKWQNLADFLQLNDDQIEKILKKSHFPLNLPYRLATKIQKGTLDDPILRQFLPIDEEEKEHAAFSEDPIKEKSTLCSPKLLHKYQGRLLLITTGSCVMNCRYCFRRHFDYEVMRKSYEPELEVIRNDESIKEVILSGGDPLSLSNETLEALINQLSDIPHLTKLRFHTRFPLGIPERIDGEFVEIMSNCRLKVWFVIHSNHPRELDPNLFNHLKKLQKEGIVILNQSVLLAGVNDRLDTLRELCETLVDEGIVPYYLHQLDRVAGASHFEVAIEKGKMLVEELRKCLPGYGVPRYVQEIAGEPYKVIL